MKHHLSRPGQRLFPAEGDAEPVLRYLARKANGMSGADIERVVREARQKARRQHRGLAWNDILDILTSAKPALPEALRWRMAVHEAGHAVARLDLGIGRITMITIDGPDGSGYVEAETSVAEVETEERITSDLVVKLAGRAAEDVVLGSVVAGSGGNPASDLARATQLALAMETAYGFARKNPLLYRPPDDRSALLIYHPMLAANVSSRLENAYGRARELIVRNHAAVMIIAKTLAVRDTLEGAELDAVINELPCIQTTSNGKF